MIQDNKLKILEKQLKYYDELYYNQDSPEITDAEYDALKQQYLNLAGKEEYDYVPGNASAIFQNVEHIIPIKSLAKVNDVKELRKELIRLAPGVIQPKEDGMTIVIYPNNRIVTRGNGFIGEDISHTGSMIPNIKSLIAKPVRAEAVMNKITFNALNEKRIISGLEPFKNPRNTVAGMLRNKDPKKVTGVTYKAYNIVGAIESETDQLAILDELGFSVIDSYSYTLDTIDEAMDYILNFDRENYPREIDGLVIKSDRPNALAEFGETGHHPKSMFAYKFPSQGAWTTLMNVIWQTGRTGRITPVALIEPTEIMGSTISRVTLHNYGIMESLGLSKKCEVYLIKANDVIPRIIEARTSCKCNICDENLERFIEPSQCPECNGSVTKINDQLFCANVSCGAKLLYNLCHLAKRDALDIEGMSEETAKKMIENGLIEHPFDLFNLKTVDIFKLPGFAQRSAEKLYDAIQAVRNPELDRFIYAAGLPNIGRTVSKDIANNFGTLDAFIHDIILNDAQEFAAIEGVGDILVQSVKDNLSLLEMLRMKITPKEKKVMANTISEKQFNIVITGTLSNPRSYYESIIMQAGHIPSSSVSKNTDYLLAGEKAGSKLAKAEKLGIPVLTEEQFLTMMNKEKSE